MFTIIGADGREYGPVPLFQVRAWIAGGRANLATKARRAGEDDWKTLGDFSEFAPAAAMTPPLLDVSAASDGPRTAPAAEPAPAGRGARLLAVLIDRTIILACALPGFFMLSLPFLKAVVQSMQNGQPLDKNLITGRDAQGCAVLLVCLLALGLFQIVLLTRRGQTIGKYALDIRIVRHGDGSAAGFTHAWLRRALLPALIECLPWIGIVFALVDIGFIFGPQRRCLHDLIADTKVVQVTA